MSKTPENRQGSERNNQTKMSQYESLWAQRIALRQDSQRMYNLFRGQYEELDVLKRSMERDYILAKQKEIGAQEEKYKKKRDSKLTEVNNALTSLTLDPYEVLKISSDAKAKHIYEAYVKKLQTIESQLDYWRQERERIRDSISGRDNTATRDMYIGIIEADEEESHLTDLMNRVRIAYHHLSSIKPYDPSKRGLFSFFSKK